MSVPEVCTVVSELECHILVPNEIKNPEILTAPLGLQ